MQENPNANVPVIRMSDVALTEVEWLWYPYLPLGKITILQGNPGEGKTYFGMELAAACTNRKPLPDAKILEPFNVIYQTAEDGLGDTVKPRLISVGADLDRVLVINDEASPLMLSDERIEKAVRENSVKLLIIDPIQAFLGAGVDMNRANEVRPILKRLGDMAQRTGCAVLLIGHLNKASGAKSTYRGLGSIDIAAAARSVLLIGRPKDEPDIRVLCHDKSSLAPEGPSLAFRLDGENGFQWIGEYDITADDLLSGKSGEDAQSKLERAKNLIIDLLMENGEVSAAEIDRFAAKQKIGERTVRKAKAELRDVGTLGSRKVGQQWYHFLVTVEEPPKPPVVPKPPPEDWTNPWKRLEKASEILGVKFVFIDAEQVTPLPPEQLSEPQTALLTDGSQ